MPSGIKTSLALAPKPPTPPHKAPYPPDLASYTSAHEGKGREWRVATSAHDLFGGAEGEGGGGGGGSRFIFPPPPFCQGRPKGFYSWDNL